MWTDDVLIERSVFDWTDNSNAVHRSRNDSATGWWLPYYLRENTSVTYWQGRPKAPPSTQNASQKSSGDKNKEVRGTMGRKRRNGRGRLRHGCWEDGRPCVLILLTRAERNGGDCWRVSLVSRLLCKIVKISTTSTVLEVDYLVHILFDNRQMLRS